MKHWQVIAILGILIVGVSVGLGYGWLVNPVVYVDNNIESLRIDYQTDLVLMTADVYAMDLNIAIAIQNLSLIRDDIKTLMTDSLSYATQMNFASGDIEKLELLKRAVDSYIPGGSDQP